MSTTLGSTAADPKARAAYLFRIRQPGDSPRAKEPNRAREPDKPAMLGAEHRASDPPGNAEDDIRFDYELRDPLSVYGLVIVAAVLVLLGIVVACVFIIC